jgi:hypothetical protein
MLVARARVRGARVAGGLWSGLEGVWRGVASDEAWLAARENWKKQREAWLAPPGDLAESAEGPAPKWVNVNARRMEAVLGNPTKRGKLPAPMPLSQVVDILCESWEDEGLFDRF